MKTVCPTEWELDLFHSEDLAAVELEAVREHLAGCLSCADLSARLICEREGFIQTVRLLYRSSDLQKQLETSSGGKGEGVATDPVAGEWGHAFNESLAPGYRFVRRIHRGGQGVVYEAIQESTRRRVAVKIVDLPEAGVSSRFEREVQILAQLRHPHIVTIHDSARSEHDAWFVMDFIEGRRLDEYFQNQKSKVESRNVETQNDVAQCSGKQSAIRNPQSAIEDTLRLFVKIAGAVSAAHLLGIVHRDLKPANILVDGGGQPHILDFGLARMGEDMPGGSSQLTITQTGQFMGTPAWASPEQAEGAVTDARSDVYSLGVMLYHALTGKPPYPVEVGTRELLNNICHRVPERPSRLWHSLGNEIDAIVLKCLAKEPARRYQNAGELAADLDHYLNRRPVSAKGDGTFYVLRKSVRRHKALAVISMLAVLSVVALAVVMTVASIRLKRERNLALNAEARADEKAHRLRQTTYGQRIALAQRAYDAGQSDQMLGFLNECPEDLREWEWYRLRYLTDDSVLQLTDDTFVPPLIQKYWMEARAISSSLPAVVSRSGRCWAHQVADGSLVVRDLSDGRKLMTINPAPSNVAGQVSTVGAGCWAFSEDGRRLARLGPMPSAACHVSMWDLKDRREINLTQPTVPFPSALDLSPDGERFVVGDDSGKIKLGEVFSGRIIAEWQGHTDGVTVLAFSPDGQRLVSASADKSIRLWEMPQHRELLTLRQHAEAVRTVAWSADGRFLASGGLDRSVRVWNARSGECVKLLRGHQDAVRLVAWGADGKTLASIDAKDVTRIWEPEHSHEVKVWDCWHSEVKSSTYNAYPTCCFSPDGKRIVVGAQSGGVKIFDALVQGRPLLEWNSHLGHISTVSYSPDGSKILTAGGWPGADFGVKVWSSTNGALLCHMKVELAGIAEAYFSHRGDRVVSAGWDHTCRVWDARTGQEHWRSQFDDECWSAAISSDDRWVAVGCRDGVVCVLDARNGRQVWRMRAHDAAANALAFDPGGRWLASGGWDGKVKLWDLRTGRLERSLSSNGQHLYKALFTLDGRRLLTAATRLVEVWGPESGDLIYSFAAHQDSVYTLEISPLDGSMLTSGNDGKMKLWPVASMPAEAMVLSTAGQRSAGQ